MDILDTTVFREIRSFSGIDCMILSYNILHDTLYLSGKKYDFVRGTSCYSDCYSLRSGLINIRCEIVDELRQWIRKKGVPFNEAIVPIVLKENNGFHIPTVARLAIQKIRDSIVEVMCLVYPNSLRLDEIVYASVSRSGVLNCISHDGIRKEPVPELTEKEIECLILSYGLSISETAVMMECSVSNIKRLRSSLFEKLGVNSIHQVLSLNSILFNYRLL